MKRIFGLILLILFIYLVPTEAQEINLPKECIRTLNQKYKGWKMANIRADIIDWFQKSKQPYQPNLIKGDWNGDRKTDYAVLVQKEKFPVDETGVILIVFIRRSATGYSFHKLGAYEYIAFIKKGEKDYDYGTQRTFIYKNDAIFTGIFEKAGSSYVWRKGKFIDIATSD